ncbi:acyl carrier protein [bacterium]|nr:MAG: acyl carrier protein [bacterium]
MDAQTLHDKLTGVFRAVFGSDTLTVTDATTAADVEGWDSLAQINLVVGAEEAFAVRFAVAEIRALKDVGGFKALIATKIQAAGR